MATKVVARQYLARHGTPTTPERLTEHQWLALDVTAAGNLARETNPPSGTIGPLPPGRGEYRNSSNVSTSASMPLALQSAEGQRREMRISARIVSNNQVALQRMCELGLGIARLARVDVLQSLHRRALVQVLDGWWQEPLPIWAVTPRRDGEEAKVRFALDHLRRHFETVDFHSNGSTGDSPAVERN